MKSDFFKSIDFKSGKITYNSFDIDPSISLSEQKFSLQEDMLQVDYGAYLIDIGWCPELDVNGRFIISLIHNFDWVNVVCKIETKNFMELKKSLQEVIDYCEVLKTHTHA